MEIENENQELVTIEETAAECIERLKAELAASEQTSEARKAQLLRIRAREQEIDRAFHLVLDQLGIHEWLVQKIQENFDFMERREICDRIEERIDEAKEEGQEIAKDQIREMIEETLNDATFDTSIIL
jgi:uncharacterized protein (UPF0305 family)